jgi:NADH dehydrogenase (ubiquinone) 1 alpha/beta subcomplex 1
LANGLQLQVKDSEKLSNTSHFSNDLGLDSLDTVEVVMAIEEEFSIEIPDKEADSILSIDKAVSYILGQPDGKLLKGLLGSIAANVSFTAH